VALLIRTKVLAASSLLLLSLVVKLFRSSAIQIGNVNFTNPRAGVEILEGIEEFLRREGIGDVAEIVGVAV
jgi:hypothetical protein